jgi:hypothetical protein
MQKMKLRSFDPSIDGSGLKFVDAPDGKSRNHRRETSFDGAGNVVDQVRSYGITANNEAGIEEIKGGNNFHFVSGQKAGGVSISRRCPRQQCGEGRLNVPVRGSAEPEKKFLVLSSIVAKPDS